jgi:hypothetical protein
MIPGHGFAAPVVAILGLAMLTAAVRLKRVG